MFGLVSDRLSTKHAAVACFALEGLGITIILLARSSTIIWISVIIFGFAMGGQIALQPLVVGEFFGLGSFATIYGAVTMAGASGVALGPTVAGVFYDIFGSYHLVFAGCALGAFFASILISCAKSQILE